MPLRAKYCSQCGVAVTTRPVEERDREVCPQCGTIFYQNPLPVAAGVVLNDKREVLVQFSVRRHCNGTFVQTTKDLQFCRQVRGKGLLISRLRTHNHAVSVPIFASLERMDADEHSLE